MAVPFYILVDTTLLIMLPEKMKVIMASPA
jgi:hypothetical protein